MASANLQRLPRAASVLAENLNLGVGVVRTVITLLDKDNTVPFIARYRKEQTGGLDPTVLRHIQAQYEQLKSIKERAESVSKKIGEKLTPEIKNSLNNALTMEEVEEVYAPFKKGSKGSHAERARQLGLGEPAELLLKNPRNVQLVKLVKPDTEGIKDVKQVSLGIQHILADVIAKDSSTLSSIKATLERNPVRIESSLSRSATKEKKKGGGDKKYEQYHGFNMPVSSLKAHQVLALNRGEQNKVLSVKLTIPKPVEGQFLSHLHKTWVPCDAPGQIQKLFRTAVDDAYNRLIKPKITRQSRSSLTKQAEKESVDLFMMNLYRLLLTPPMRGKSVLGLDPGFSHGCKLAVLGSTGEVLETRMIFPFGKNANVGQAKNTVVDLVLKHSCEYVAIGNGVGCRDAETFISQLIKQRELAPLDIAYCIVSEDGASIYSASPEAAAELPSLDTSLRGAVSIGRRLQDPLVELVKIEPKHLGIGMYQHDIPDSLLRGALDGVVEDCVSFVGVDLNVAGVSMLRRIAGLNDKKAKAILTWREENGAFTNREQLKAVKGIGLKSYEQCVGFVRIMNNSRLHSNAARPSASGQCSTADNNSKAEIVVLDSDEEVKMAARGRKRKGESAEEEVKKKKKKKAAGKQEFCPDPLDMTWIHPESYPVAKSAMEMMGVLPEQIGQPLVKAAIDGFLQTRKIEELAGKFSVGTPTLQHIIDGLRQPTDHDIRVNFQKPLFKRNVTSLEDLRPGTQLSGRVTNMTSFGAFVDCGVGRDGLVHNSNMGRFKGRVGLGDLVEVTVRNVDIAKQHISLILKDISSAFNPQLLVSVGTLSQTCA
ncbi:RNA binding [Desmophyllum pertusum]|uniref:RNA binding n=1 Tax=Desmophyllum pertusum TaxID=174260 RepID=A0A9X0CEC0_9CNID|nr:RNA binding [Desmophyllum pertusum]